MNPWNHQAWFPPGYAYPTAVPGYWQQPAVAPAPAWQEPKSEAYFSMDRYKTRKYPNLHPVLSADTTLVRIDIRKPPSSEGVQSSTYYAYRHAYATANYATHIRLISREFPWSVDIKTQYGTPITCGDVWNAIYTALQQPLADSEWGMVVGDKERARKIERAAKRREETDKGKKLKRLDWLGDVCILRGLEKDEDFSKRRTAYAEEECPEIVLVKMAAT